MLPGNDDEDEENQVEEESQDQPQEQAQTGKGGRPKGKAKTAAPVEVPVFKFSVADLVGKLVEVRLTSMRDGDSTVCGTLAGMDEFFIYIRESEEVTAYNSAHMVSIRARRPMPVSKGREGFVKPGEDDVVNKSQADIERQKDANKKRREEILTRGIERPPEKQAAYLPKPRHS